jgi:hypothetical protein
VKYKTFLLGGLISILIFSQCLHSVEYIFGSSSNISRQYPISDFSGISFSNKCDAVIEYSDSFSITITANDNIEQHVNVEKAGDYLRIYLDHGYMYRKITFKVHITLPTLKEVTASGASKANIAGFNSENDFTVVLSGASNASGSITSRNASFILSGASDITLSGKANSIDCKLSGASKCNFSSYKCGDAYVKCSGASKVTVNADGTISGRLSGASKLYYYGNPTLGSFYTSGSSSIKKRG